MSHKNPDDFIAAEYLFLAYTAVIALPIIVLELIFLRKPSFVQPKDERYFIRVCIKSIGLFTTLAAIAFIYWLIPFYGKDGATGLKNLLSFYLNEIGIFFVLQGIIVSLFYLSITDRTLKQPYDGLWQVGNYILSSLKITHTIKDTSLIKQHILQWCVKGFFLPLMAMWLLNNIRYFQGLDPNVWDFFTVAATTDNLIKAYGPSLSLLYTVDLAFAIAGYMLTLKLLDTHIRSAEYTWSGWIACIMCYPPFLYLMNEQLIQYNNGTDFMTYFAASPYAQMSCGFGILLLTFFYTAATVQFGIRFSNLTHRGIITNGIYAYTKHPAYITKNLSWWLMYLPFLAFFYNHNFEMAVHHSIMLFCLNGVYYWRAKTEEKHLMNDPVYAQYAQYIAEYGLIARIKKVILPKK
jgi:protein-S-isoprenylcysteine O-methyltransferase Ste14